MGFISWGYYLFLAVLLTVYYLLPHKIRWAALLGGSLVFCCLYNIYSAIWLAAVALLSFAAARGIALLREKDKVGAAKGILAASLVAFFGSLFAIKYSRACLRLFEVWGHTGGGEGADAFISIAMPVGISFYLFQVTGYLIDVYRKKTEAVRHFGHYFLSLAFFPKLAQGPIAPVEQLAPQFGDRKRLDPLSMRKGAVRILIGLIKKAVIADRLAVIADRVFTAPGQLSALSTAIGIVCYAFQLYTDFAGYTDVAIGTAQMFGIVLPENFKQPYLARSVADFWRRWHLTLSNWLREYIYFPLGGSRVRTVRWAINVLIVFLVSGMWHGSGLTFIIWGAIHGLYQIIGKLTAGPRTALKTKLFGKKVIACDILSVASTFVLICAAWTFFRADSFGNAVKMLVRLACGDWSFSLAQLGVNAAECWTSLILVILVIAADLISRRASILEWIENRVLPIRWMIYLVMLFVLILFGMYGSLSAQSFIYVSF